MLFIFARGSTASLQLYSVRAFVVLEAKARVFGQCCAVFVNVGPEAGLFTGIQENSGVIIAFWKFKK